MKGLEFPIIGTKVKGLNKKFDLTSPQGRKIYFQDKVGDEIKQIKKFLTKNNFMAFFLGKKGSGKGTYSHIFTEIFGEEKVALVSVGDVVREFDANWEKFSKSKDLDKLKNLYRGYISFDDAVDSLLGRSTEKLLPTEFILALLKFKIQGIADKSIFVDGLPRELDQVSYSLYFRDLAGFTEAQDLFILIDIPEIVIDERIKHRVVCPICHATPNTKLFITEKLGYDKKSKEIYLICDNPFCKGARAVRKEGDDLGIDPIRSRLDKDEEILKKVFALHGIPKILLRNHVPFTQAQKYFDSYELTPEYVLKWDSESQKVKVTEKPWVIKDDNGVKCYSLLPAPVVVAMIKQLAEILNV